VRWPPDRRGRWHSQEIAVAIAFEGARVTVYARDGRRQLREGEIARRDAEIAALQRLLDQQQDRK